MSDCTTGLSQREASYHAKVQRDPPRNFAANLAHGLMGMTGFYLLAAPTFVPAYIYLLSGSKLAVGLALGAQFIGMAMSSIWSASVFSIYTEGAGVDPAAAMNRGRRF